MKTEVSQRERVIREICANVAAIFIVDSMSELSKGIYAIGQAQSLCRWVGFPLSDVEESRDTMFRSIRLSAWQRGPIGWRIIGEYRKAMNRDRKAR